MAEVDKLVAANPHLEPRLALIVEYYKLREVEGDNDADIQAIAIGDLSSKADATKKKKASANNAADETEDAAPRKRRRSAAPKRRKPTSLTTEEGRDTMPADAELEAAAEHLQLYGQWAALLKSSASGKPAKPLGASYRRKVMQFFDAADEARDTEAQVVDAFAAVGLSEDKLTQADFATHLDYLRRLAQIRTGKSVGLRGCVTAWVESILGRHVAHALLTSSPQKLKGNEIVAFLVSNEKLILAEIEAEREYQRMKKRAFGQRSDGGHAEADAADEEEDEDEDGNEEERAGAGAAGGLAPPATPMRDRLAKMAHRWMTEANNRAALRATTLKDQWVSKESQLATVKLRKHMESLGIAEETLPKPLLDTFRALPCITLADAEDSIARIPELFGELIDARKAFSSIVKRVCLEGRGVTKISRICGV